jgi:hypothetical protein
MSRILFVVSHLSSGSTGLIQILNENPRIQIHQTNIIYEGLADLNLLTSQRHKLRNTAAIHGDHLLFNTSFLNKSLYSCAKFIYCFKSGALTVNQLIKDYHYKPESALNYYCFRIRRIYEMAHQIPQSVIINWTDLEKGTWMPEVEEYLQLKEKLENKPDLFSNQIDDIAPASIKQEAEDYYEKYFYLFKQLKIKD